MKERLGYIEGVVSAILNTVLFALKLWVGLVSGSVAMVADAWHTLSDTLTSAMVVAGFWVASKPEDREHPFGHGRAELITAIVISVLLGMVGLNFLKESWLQLRGREQVSYSVFAMIVFAVSALLKELLASFSIWAGKKIGSQALLADGWHHRSDAIASAVIVAGALLGRYLWWIDGVMGLIVSGLIIYAAYDILKNSAGPLLGEGVSRTVEEKINAIAREHLPQGNGVHHLHLHRYGDHREMTAHMTMPADFSLEQSHEICEAIENEAREKLAIELTLHPEPYEEQS